MCQARRVGDQMCCGKCGIQWDVNDTEPPACRQSAPPVAPITVHKDRRAYLEFIKEKGLKK